MIHMEFKENNIKFKKYLIIVGYCLFFVLLNVLLSLSGIFINASNYVTDLMYQKEQVVNSDIKIIAIDDKSLEELGEINTWTREYYLNIVKKLNEDNHAPAVIGFDILFTGKQDPLVDQAFAEECNKTGNVVVAMNLLFGTEVNVTDSKLNSNINVTGVSKAYNELFDATKSGYVNTVLDTNDGLVRKCIPQVKVNDEIYESFSYQIYKEYQNYYGNEVIEYAYNTPKRFNYSSTPGEQYTIVSFSDVINGKIPLNDFKGSIVLVGAFAEGLQDSFYVPISRGVKMHGVQIHANIIEAYLNDDFVSEINNIVVILINSILLFAVCFFAYRRRIVKLSIISLGSVIGLIICQIVLFKLSCYLPILTTLISILIMYIVQIVYQYVYERTIKTKALRAFKKYVDPQVVDNVIKTGNYKIELGGEKVDIACLFVDIRGFTTISESLDPTDVVIIINEYLSLTSKAILNNKGTLDKYIGDATMAIFNAPFETKDYVYNAVLTGMEIAAGSSVIEKKFLEQYGVKVSFGIGINCGKAVVGNIGSNFRMDYTAIGDTVNTASRLEGKAAPGEILITEAVYDAVKDRIDAEFVDSYQFKGKKEFIKVYRVLGKK